MIVNLVALTPLIPRLAWFTQTAAAAFVELACSWPRSSQWWLNSSPGRLLLIWFAHLIQSVVIDLKLGI
jgi:hypothetical protein